MFRAMAETPLPKEIVLADSATKLGADAEGAVIVTGSHGARYAAYLTLKAHPRAVIHNDAGIGKDSAGIAVIALAEALGIAAATASHASCRIGDATDMIARGRISHANAVARGLGVREEMPCREAALLLVAARPTGRDPEPIAEARRTLKQPGWQRDIVLMDSASLARPEDKGQIVVTASHGALVGGKASSALQVDGFAAVYNDAGVGIDRAGISRLPTLDQARRRRRHGLGPVRAHRRCPVGLRGRRHLPRQRRRAPAGRQPRRAAQAPPSPLGQAAARSPMSLHSPSRLEDHSRR